MALPWHKLNHQKQNYYIILGSVTFAIIIIGVVFIINLQ